MTENEKEYEVELIDAKIRNSSPTVWIIVTIFIGCMALISWPCIVFAICTGIIAFFRYRTQKELKEKKEQLLRK